MNSEDTTNQAVLRTVYSTVDHADPSVTADILGEVCAAVEKGHTIRESYSLGEGSEKEYHFHVVQFELDKTTRWAFVHDDPAEAELIDSADQDAIVALYEKQISELINISGWTFDETDVDISASSNERQ